MVQYFHEPSISGYMYKYTGLLITTRGVFQLPIVLSPSPEFDYQLWAKLFLGSPYYWETMSAHNPRLYSLMLFWSIICLLLNILYSREKQFCFCSLMSWILCFNEIKWFIVRPNPKRGYNSSLQQVSYNSRCPTMLEYGQVSGFLKVYRWFRYIPKV